MKRSMIRSKAAYSSLVKTGRLGAKGCGRRGVSEVCPGNRASASASRMEFIANTENVEGRLAEPRERSSPHNILTPAWADFHHLLRPILQQRLGVLGQALG